MCVCMFFFLNNIDDMHQQVWFLDCILKMFLFLHLKYYFYNTNVVDGLKSNKLLSSPLLKKKLNNPTGTIILYFFTDLT